ncbi:putative ribonuclease H-like domain-containing protein [Tanacetum coccineum]
MVLLCEFHQVNALSSKVQVAYFTVPTGRYVVPTGRVIATISIKVPTHKYIVPAGYTVPTGRTRLRPVWKNVANIPSFVVLEDSLLFFGSRNRPASVPAGRPFPAGWHNPAARPMTRPKSHYFQQDNPHTNKDLGIVYSGCSRSMTGFLRVPRRHNLYCFNLTDIIQKEKSSVCWQKHPYRSTKKWHRRMAHVKHQNKNKLAITWISQWLLPKLFIQMKTSCGWGGGLQQRKQHKASYKGHQLQSAPFPELSSYFIVPFWSTPSEVNDHKHYSLVVTDDFSRCDNRIEFKNSNLIELCESKGIKRDYSVARTPQQNGVAKRKNRTLIEAARTMLADSKLPTIDHLGKFEGKANEGFLVGYSAHSKAYRVYNLSNKKIEETLNLRYMEDKPNVQGLGHEWYFDLDYLTDSLGYTRFKSNQPAGTQDTNTHAGTHDDSDSECDEQVIVVPSFPSNHFSGPKVHTASATVESTSDYAEELARLQGQAYAANSAAKNTWDTANMVPAASDVPAT